MSSGKTRRWWRGAALLLLTMTAACDEGTPGLVEPDLADPGLLVVQEDHLEGAEELRMRFRVRGIGESEVGEWAPAAGRRLRGKAAG